MYSRAACRYLLWERSGIETTPPTGNTALHMVGSRQKGRDRQGHAGTLLYIFIFRFQTHIRK